MAQALQTTWFDRAIATVAPGWALRREVSRRALRDFNASYSGGLPTRLSDPWSAQTSHRYSTAGDRQQIADMRGRAWRVDQNNPVGRSILNTEVDNVVANGLTLQVRTESTAFNDEAEERFAEWMEEADLYGQLGATELQRLFYRSCKRDGDGGLVLAELDGKLRLQFVPAWRIRNPIGKYDVRVLDGVEIDAIGRRKRFHVEVSDDNGIATTTAVPARDLVYFPANLIDSSQIRPPTCFDTVFGQLDQLDGYIDGVVTAARLATVIGLVFKKKSPDQALRGLPNTLTNSRGDQQRAITMENGSLAYIGTDEDIVTVTPNQPMSQTPDFVRAMLRLIGMPFDMPLELIAKDMSTVNFASARIGLLGYYRACRARQKIFGFRLGQIYRWWSSKTVARGEFTSDVPELYWKHEFVPQGWDYTDPISEVQSDMMQVEAGLKTLQMCAIERGRDFDKMQVEIAEGRKWREDNDLPEVRCSLTRDVEPPPKQPDVGPPPAPPAEEDDEDDTDA